MAEKEFTVVRPHIGDKDYNTGDTRIADANDVAHLVASGCLIEKKVEAATENKAEAERLAAEATAKKAKA